jgi:predicted HicB family RNase H-like nuclease
MGTKEQRRGRPRKSSERRKSESVLIRMESSEKAGFALAAEVAGVPLAVWIRERLRKAAVRELEEIGKEIPFIN